MERIARKVIPRGDLAEWSAEHRRHRRRVVFTNGCFDLLHPGHLQLLETAAGHGDVLLVAINGDESVRRLKGPQRPIYPAGERGEILLAMRWVDAVTVFEEDTPMETIECVRPDVLVKGAEYQEDDIVGADFVRRGGGTVVRVRMKQGHSTRGIVGRIRNSV